MKRVRCAVTGKYAYTTFEAAVHAALTSNRKRGTPLRPYPCPDCDGAWHLTKRPANPVVVTVPGPFTPADMARLAGRRQEISS